ncbi:MAG: GNAT family N-acetyltransferase [Mesorhizobium sp.]|nr:GNAT family N-acetyltransferase [Mesorhizobium sp.]
MFVRTAGERDLDAVRALLVETWHDTYDSLYGATRVSEITDEWHSIDALRRQLILPNADFLVADDGTQLGGMAFASATADPKIVMLRQLYVRPGQQGRGIGGMLLEEIESSFFDSTHLRVEVEERLPKAVAFYLGEGFVQIDRVEIDGLFPTALLTLEKPLVFSDTPRLL